MGRSKHWLVCFGTSSTKSMPWWRRSTPSSSSYGGCVPALEWLAERVEERSTVRVTMNVRGMSRSPLRRAADGGGRRRVPRRRPRPRERHPPRTGVAGDGPHRVWSPNGSAWSSPTTARDAGGGRTDRRAPRVAAAWPTWSPRRPGAAASLLVDHGRGSGRRARHDRDVRLARPAGSGPLREDPQRRCGRDPDSGHRSAAAMLDRLTHRVSRPPAGGRTWGTRWNVSETD